MEEEIKVTIWCLAYNHEKYIRKALEGFVSQRTSFKFEALIHDDASTDKTTEIIEEFRKKYPNIIKPIYEKENRYNQGISYLNEICMPRAKGKYIAFCEGDDYWIDNYKLQKQYNLMEANKNVVLCSGKTVCTNEDDSYNADVIPSQKTAKYLSTIISKDDFIKIFFTKDNYPFHTSTYFIRKSVFENDIVSKELAGYFNGDIKILLSAALVGDFAYLDTEMSNRRLFTLGNWNTRFLNFSLEEKFSFYKKIINGYLKYDDLLSNKYSEYINYSICNLVLHMATIFKPNDVLNYYKELGLKKTPKTYSLFERIKFNIFLFNPNFYYFLHKIKHI